MQNTKIIQNDLDFWHGITVKYKVDTILRKVFTRKGFEMTGLIIATHGELAKAALEAVQMLAGEQEAVKTIGFCMGDSLEMLLQRYMDALHALKSCEDILIVTDLKGGSPCNAATVMKSQNANVRVLAGLSIPMLIQFFEDRTNGLTLEESVETILEVSQISACEIVL